MAETAFSEERSAEVVAASFDTAENPRLRRVMVSLVEHLHAFVKDVELTDAEWARAIEFLTATGQLCDDVRQEFVLLSDVLGVSMLVETINHRSDGAATESTVLGPFHLVQSPPRALGDNIALHGTGEPCLVTGTVRGPDGAPLAGASVDVWQASEEGWYDVQQPGVQPDGNLRGLFPPTMPGGSGSRRSSRRTTRSRRTGRSARCCRRPGAARSVPRTSTSSSVSPDTCR